MKIETDGICAICGEEPKGDRALGLHHLQWYPEEVTMPVCTRCHYKIHGEDGMEYYRPPAQPTEPERKRAYRRQWIEQHPEYTRHESEARLKRTNVRSLAWYYRHRSEVSEKRKIKRAQRRAPNECE